MDHGALAGGQRLTEDEQQGIKLACRTLFRQLPELWEGALPGEEAPQVVVEPVERRRDVITKGKVPRSVPVESLARGSDLFGFGR